MRRSMFAMAAAVLAATPAIACRDELPSAPARIGDHPLLSESGDALFGTEVKAACNERISELQPLQIVAKPFGASGQAAVLKPASVDFPLEGDSYLVVSSGKASAFTQDGTTKSTRYTTPCADGRCDVGGVDLALTLPATATSVELDFRYYTWEDGTKSDPFRVYVVDGSGTPVLKREATVASEIPADQLAPGLQFGKELQHVTVDASQAVVQQDGSRVLTLRLEASDSYDGFATGGGLDSGALVDNIRVLSAPSTLTPPQVSGTAVDPTPVPYYQASTLTSFIDDRNTGGSGVRLAEYNVDDGPFASMGAAAGSAFGAPSMTAQQSLPAYAASTVTVRTVCVRAEDMRGNVTRPDCIQQAVYDPAQGYVTGSGFFESLPGAYTLTENPSVDYAVRGRAQFGFSSRYKVGSNTPSGNTRFVFRAGGLEFNSTVYQYLVVSGPQARYKGKGKLTFNDQPLTYTDPLAGDRLLSGEDYGFIVAGTDGQVTGGGGVDKVRIKIWRLVDGYVVYDNQRQYDAATTDVSESATPITALTGGRIMIKK